MDFQSKYYKYKSKYYNFLKRAEQSKNMRNNMLDEKTSKFIQSLDGSTPVYKLTPVAARSVLDNVQSDQSYKTTVDIINTKIIYENVNLDFSIFRPKGDKTLLKTAIYFHGGGWVLGNIRTHGRLVAELTNSANIAIVFVNYTPAPEAKFPTQLMQCFLTTKYISENSQKYNLDVSNIVLIGDSVGGNMVAATTMLAKKANISIKAQILLYPVTDSAMDTTSYDVYAKGPWLEKAGMQWFFHNYISDDSELGDIMMTPLRSPDGVLSGLPQSLIITDENDVLRDEGEMYAHRLMQVGVNVTAVRYLGTIHDFLMLDPLKDTPAAVSARSLITSYLKQILKN